MLLHHFDHPLPWKQSKMATKHNYLKSLKLQSHCMQINFLFTVSTNIMLSSLLPRMLWLLCISFILLYYLHFMLTNNISIRHKTLKNIAIYKSLWESKDQYIYKHHANVQDYLYSKRSLRVLQLRKWCKSETVRKRTWKKEKHLTWYESPGHLLTNYTC